MTPTRRFKILIFLRSFFFFFSSFFVAAVVRLRLPEKVHLNVLLNAPPIRERTKYIGSQNNKEEKSQQSRIYDKNNVAEAALFK